MLLWGSPRATWGRRGRIMWRQLRQCCSSLTSSSRALVMCRVKEHELHHIQSARSASERDSLVSQEGADAARGATLRLQGELRQLHARLARMQQEQRLGCPTTLERCCSRSCLF